MVIKHNADKWAYGGYKPLQHQRIMIQRLAANNINALVRRKFRSRIGLFDVLVDLMQSNNLDNAERSELEVSMYKLSVE